MIPSSRRLRSLALLFAVALTAAACGSSLTEQEVLARSATEVAGSPAGGTGGRTGESSTTAPVTAGDAATIADGSPGSDDGGSDSSEAALGAGPAESGGGADGASSDDACSTQDTGPIVIATVGNYSGAGGSAQGGFPPAIQTWASHVNNRGGLCGRKVEVIVQDDGGDQARYASLARDSVENRGAVAFVGNGAVLSGAGGLRYHQHSGVPVIGNDCTNKHWYDSPVLFPTCPAPFDQVVSTLINGFQLFDTREFGYVYCTEAQTCLDINAFLNDGALGEAGAELRYKDSVSISQIDFTAECQAARNSGVEVLWVAADPATVSRMAQSCSRQNYFPHYMCGSVSCGTASFTVNGFGDAALFSPVFPFVGGSGGAIDEYNVARETFAPDVTPSVDFSIGWASAKLFELAATRAAQASGTITPKSLVDALYTVRDETLGGLTTPLNFGPNGASNGNCYFSMQGDGTGGFTVPNGSQAICR